MKRVGTSVALLFMSIAMPVLATETINYTYDAKGRLIKVVRSGSVNNGVQTQYVHDKADNRKKVVVTGSPNTAP